MKLIQYTFRKLAFPLLIVMAVWATAFYFLILYEIDDETNDSLQNYKEIIIKQFLSDSTALANHPDIMTRYQIREIPAKDANLSEDVFYDSTKYIEIEMEFEPIRVLRSNFMDANGKYYELVIETSTLEKEDLIETILFSIIILYLVLLVCILLVNRYVFKKSFRPLYTILDWLKKFRPDKPIEPLNNDTPIEEFAILNEGITDASKRSSALYEQQKQFVENASHEMQTPLAVCLNKLELLSENPDCTQEQLTEIADIHQTLGGIVKMNKSLLLLSRIENKQFADTETVSINAITKKIIQDFSDIYEEKQIKISVSENASLKYIMNESLATILIKNIVKNAFVHNIADGEINITISENTFSIENTGNCPELNKEKLFRRFAKQTDNNKSTGLGLAIVQSIILTYKISITYHYTGKHQFVLTFR
ncbi:signal transduction histidine kinase [Parabacteroides sp. PF5-5]|uniref:sensor histidine kinase n=1 Tax=unclassified Parabacteroides TaxID=2649774 RepID=UPI0024743210|nr:MULTISPECIES: HAMP domain-containing sensor histidine kinase [unclassified Parabacteroides]MDH6305087.1 signal transduction histidine kinase [Parabacteroides sp. PH5-39]MDH6316437.1 signal transduction histidine kinase [Parabacteroides sp. PF5-13]MDH6319947.1 signal transduction histidine kinase [Parabacteroides sp. PH5-13]MDH6323820.1 signal transduction histidine kinase [Parabacteroides sp. PH5-8]MDH6327624.1 signal transduction histidine kinase [Parabacteroides sp. PH5-41]